MVYSVGFRALKKVDSFLSHLRCTAVWSKLVIIDKPLLTIGRI